MPHLDLDVTGLIQKFHDGGCPDRKDLIRFFQEAMNFNRAAKVMLAQVCDECAKNNLPPVHAMGCSMMYGMVLGVLIERDRIERERRLNN